MDGAMSLTAAAANCRCSRVVYVGNIPFQASEEQVRDACELIGPVRSLRLGADPATTGRHRGYAFVEYRDDETARSACRNLHGHLLLGRELRVGLAGRRARARGEHDPVGLEDAVHAASLVAGTPPPDSVIRFLAARSARELREMVGASEARSPGVLNADAVEMARHLIDMAAAAEEAMKKERSAAAEAPDDDDRRAKLRKVEEDGDFKGKVMVPAAGVTCY